MREMQKALVLPSVNEERFLAIMSGAEVALAEATEMVDILNLRSDADAYSAMLAAKGAGPYAQRVKVYQLKCERKAGDILNVFPAGDGPKPAGAPAGYKNAAAAAEELGITRMMRQSWQREARLPDRIFSAWVKDLLENNIEVSQRALLRLARPTVAPSPPEKPLTILDRWAETLKELSDILYSIGTYRTAKEAKLHLSYAKHAVAGVTTMLADAKALVRGILDAYNDTVGGNLSIAGETPA
ncbi:MAG: hypothetical protein WC935_00095 [Thermoleophilia bacterium]